MVPRLYHIHRKILIFIFVLILFWIMLAVSDPLLRNYNPAISQIFHNIFAPVCHQIPERSIQINSYPMALCVRCTGFYLFGAVILFFYIFHHRIRILPLIYYMLLLTPLLIDFICEKTGLYHNIAIIRFFTGGLLGLSAFHLLVVSLSTRIDVLKYSLEKKVWITNR